MEEGLAPTIREAERAWDEDTAIVSEILEMRALVSAKEQVDAASAASKEPPLTPSVRRFYELQAALLREGRKK